MEFSKYTTETVQEVLKDLKTSSRGLDSNEAQKRLNIYGFNEIEEKEIGLFDVFLRQFKSPFFYLLFIAVLTAFLIGEKIDGLVILIFVVVNVFLGFLQEAKAEKAIILLKRYIPVKVRVLRNGQERVINKKFLVPGDIVFVEGGNVIPADLRILKTENFLIDESALSGESIPVIKISKPLSEETKKIFEASNIAFTGTSVSSGRACGVVINTGTNTVLGEIAKSTSAAKRKSIYEKDLFKFCRIIVRIVVVTITFVFLANLIIKGSENFFDFLLFCIALIVSIIPEALPLIVTFSFSTGALKLAKEKVVVKRLSAVEDLGNIEILCTDKTGTITENKLKLEGIFSSNKEKCLQYALFASSYAGEKIESSKNPFDIALFNKASKKIKESLEKVKIIYENPFDPFQLKSSVLIEDETALKVLIVRGAPEKILEFSSDFNGPAKKEIRNEIIRKGQEGKRVLAIAFKKFNGDNYSAREENELTFFGYFTFIDPLKKTAKESILLAKKLGVKVKILTGDSAEVATQIAKEVNLISSPKEVILGEKLDSLDENEFKNACENFSVFARVSPKTKHKIVEALAEKHEVGFFGEGMNDAPALKAAHLAIAAASATDIAREVSDIMLLENDLKVIINGIKQGRNIFSNINKYIKCTLSSNFGNFYSVAVIALFVPFLPMLPAQILLVNLLSDFPLIAVTTDRVDAEELRRPKLYQLSKFIPLIVILAFINTVFDLIFFGIFYKTGPANIQTLWYIESILTEIALIFSIRTSHLFLKAKMPSFTLILLSFLTIAVTVLLPFTLFGKEFFHFITPSISSLIIILFLVVSYFIISEVGKLFYFRYWYKNSK